MTEKSTDLSTRTLATAGSNPEVVAEPERPSKEAQHEERTPKGQPDKHTGGRADLLPAQMSTRFREKWEAIQTEFVDEPRRSVEHATNSSPT